MPLTMLHVFVWIRCCDRNLITCKIFFGQNSEKNIILMIGHLPLVPYLKLPPVSLKHCVYLQLTPVQTASSW